jgi:hypothetical protein
MDVLPLVGDQTAAFTGGGGWLKNGWGNTCRGRKRFADLRWAGFSAQMFIRRTALPITTKLSAEHETPPIANVLLWAAFLIISCSVLLVRQS